MNDCIKNSREYLIIIILYTILTIILTYPMAFHMSDTIGGGDEAFTCWSLTWTTKSIVEDPFNLFHANIFYPANEYSLALSEHMVGWAPLSIPIYSISHDPVFTHNFLRLLTFVLCGFGMYLLSYRYTNNRYAAFIAGIFFAFFAYRLHIQLHLLAMQWIPFMLLFLDKFFYSLKFRDIFICSLFFILEALSGWYVGIFSSIIGILFIIGYVIIDTDVRKSLFTRKVTGMILISLALICIVLIPYALPYFEASKHYDAERDLDEPINSSWALDPNIIISQFGIIFLIFAFIGLLFPLKPEKKKIFSKMVFIRQQKIPIIFACIGIVSYILTLGPVLKLNGNPTGILTPYYLIYTIIPYLAIVRDLSRFSFIISFAGAVLAGFGAAVIINRIKKDHLKIPVAIGLIFLAILGSWNVPVQMPLSLTTGDQIPEEYGWLANQSDDFAIIEIPTRWVEDNSEYTYYSVYHWKDMVNGYSGRDVEEASKIMRDTGVFFPSNSTLSLLQDIGVKYILIHTDRIRALEKIPDQEAGNFTARYISALNHKITQGFNSSIRSAGSFKDTYVYEIIPNPDIQPDEVLLLFQNGWYGSNYLPEFYLKNTGKVKVYAGSDGEYELYFLAEPISGNKNLSLSVNGYQLGTITAPPGGLTEGGSRIKLKKGFNEIVFSSTCTKLCDIPQMDTFSDKCISFKFANLTVF